MATRSSICVMTPERKFKIIYCHFDGYISHHGKILLNYYNSQERAEELVSNGYLSVLDKSTECPERHSFENQVDGYCVYYGRDRGEEEVGVRTFDSYREARDCVSEEYNYLWTGKEWQVDPCADYQKNKTTVLANHFSAKTMDSGHILYTFIEEDNDDE